MPGHIESPHPRFSSHGKDLPVADQQFLMPSAQICQTLAVVSSSPGQLLLTTVVRFPDVLQSGFEECLKGCSCRCLACTICVLLEVMGQGWGLVGPTPLPHNSLLGTGLVVQQVGPTGSLKQFGKPQPGLCSPGPRSLPPSTEPFCLSLTARAWTQRCNRMAYSSFSFLSCSCSRAFSASVWRSWPWQVDNTWGWKWP